MRSGARSQSRWLYFATFGTSTDHCKIWFEMLKVAIAFYQDGVTLYSSKRLFNALLYVMVFDNYPVYVGSACVPEASSVFPGFVICFTARTDQSFAALELLSGDFSVCASLE